MYCDGVFQSPPLLALFSLESPNILLDANDAHATVVWLHHGFSIYETECKLLSVSDLKVTVKAYKICTFGKDREGEEKDNRKVREKEGRKVVIGHYCVGQTDTLGASCKNTQTDHKIIIKGVSKNMLTIRKDTSLNIHGTLS